MSMPTFPTDMNTPTKEEAFNQVISSIALEELGLSHVINAEGEKLQYILGTLEGSLPPEPATIDDVLNVNKSVQKMLETISYYQMFLKGKMTDVLRHMPVEETVISRSTILPFSMGKNCKNLFAIPTQAGDYGSAMLIGNRVHSSATVNPVLFNAPISYTDYHNQPLEIAMVMPQTGKISELAIQFYATEFPVIDHVATFVVQLYRAKKGETVFYPMPSTFLELQPTISATSSDGTVLSGQLTVEKATDASFQSGDALLLVAGVRAETTGATSSLFGGYLSAGVSIN
ncbi:MAG: hypothetical protein FWG67_00055 [Defluviitaleaceae bacterium]|nr:hypothetical protein [Defluviitaleaceae bacterium]